MTRIGALGGQICKDKRQVRSTELGLLPPCSACHDMRAAPISHFQQSDSRPLQHRFNLSKSKWRPPSPHHAGTRRMRLQHCQSRAAFNTPSWAEKAASLLGVYKHFDCFLPQALGAMSGRAGVGSSLNGCRPAAAAAAAAATAATDTRTHLTHLAALGPAPKCLSPGDSTPSSDGTSTSDRLTVRKRTQIETDDEGARGWGRWGRR